MGMNDAVDDAGAGNRGVLYYVHGAGNGRGGGMTWGFWFGGVGGYW